MCWRWPESRRVDRESARSPTPEAADGRGPAAPGGAPGPCLFIVRWSDDLRRVTDVGAGASERPSG